MAALQLGMDFCENEVFLGLWSEEDRSPKNFMLPGISDEESIPLFVIPLSDGSFVAGREALNYSKRERCNGTSLFFGEKAKKKVKLNGKEYETVDLLAGFLSEVIGSLKRQFAGAAIGKMCITGERLTSDDKKRLSMALTSINFGSEHYCIISHADAFMRYMTGAEEARRKLSAVAIDLDSEGAGIYFYTPADVRNGFPAFVETEDTKDILKCSLKNLPKPEQKTEAFDAIISLGLKKNKATNFLYVTGKSMEDENIKNVLRKYANERLKIFSGRNLYAAGACYRAVIEIPEAGLLGDGQIRHNVLLEGYMNGNVQNIPLLLAGQELAKAEKVISVIPDATDRLVFHIKDMRNGKTGTVSFPLENINDRENKTHRIEVTVSFANLKTLVIKVRDLGFGSIYRASYRVFEQTVML